MSCEHGVPDNVSCWLCRGDAVDIKEFNALKEEIEDFKQAIVGYELGISSQQDEIEDLNRLISAWRSVAGKARAEIEAQQITINKLSARCDRDDKLIFQMKDEISKLKAKNNDLKQKLGK